MSHNGFISPNGLSMPSGGLASRRGGGQNIKPLSFDALKSPTDTTENGVPTPRTSRGHLLAGLRTAPKSATATSFATSATSIVQPHMSGSRTGSIAGNAYGAPEHAYHSGPKTSLPRMPTQQQQQQQHQGYSQMNHSMMGMGHQHYTPEQILAPPELHLDEQVQEQLDPSLYAQLVTTNLYLAQQQQRLQQQLLSIQAAAQQFQGMNMNGQQSLQQQALQQQMAHQQMALQNLYQQQQHQLKNLQQSMNSSMPAQQNMYAVYDPATQQTYFVDQNTAQQMNSNISMDQTPSTPQGFYQQQNNSSTPRVQVSPPPTENNTPPVYRTTSPPKKVEIMDEPTPLPPPSANAFRRGHKKSSSLANNKGLALSTDENLRSAGLKTASFPLTPMSNGGYGPGQARAGEHPIRQPRGPPALDELRSKPTSRYEGSKNFSARTRRSAVHNLVKAGMVRRKGTTSSCGSMSPVSETAEEVCTPLTDNESDSGRSGSGSLSGDAEPSLASSRTSTSGSWGAIGSDRPSSRQKSRRSVDSQSSTCEDGSFASVFKHGSQRPSKTQSSDGQRKAPMLVLTTSAEKRKGSMPVA
ncbi:Uu.00g095740.m01.CDS01 [Anthostomella pinea]|uniref:Uu.00g095740.m01.CDS01 n=1 Tax=Anthostomella pinea TaxID=933095 RepID=A0AAI8VD31_9PEZI|nr:Uu.00g095740.m01.CDS01 [Anthostomella pinea]